MTNGKDPINSNSFDPQIDAKGGISNERISEINKGLTKREYFAAMAMQGILSSGRTDITDSIRIAELSVYQSDVLIKSLNE